MPRKHEGNQIPQLAFYEEGKEITELCYEYEGGVFYTILHLHGWSVVMMIGDGEGYTLTYLEH